jgi:acyl-coenzyme A synthetase/AMP-(fatty) acid ligase/acyl carrier protein
LTDEDVAVAYRPCSLIASLWDHFGALLQGVTTVVAPSVGGIADPVAIVGLAAKYGVTHASGSPAFWQAITEQPPEHLALWRRMRLGITSGEQPSISVVRAWKRAFPSAKLLNMYSATECFRPCAFDVSDLDEAASTVPAGRPMPYVALTVVNGRSEPVSPGEVGEIEVAGPCVAVGYLNQPELTNERFATIGGTLGRRFRTGDLGRWLSGGVLEITGRTDDLVKVRGYRVELGDVEAALAQHGDLREVAVVAHEDPLGGRRLCAYVVPRVGCALTSTEIRRHARERLPAYMVPSVFISVDALPRTRSGKIDRQALPPLPRQVAHEAVSTSQRSFTEYRVERIVADTMGVQCVDRDQKLIDLGVHSLMAMQIVARLYDEFEVHVPLYEFLSADLTITNLASSIDELGHVAPIGSE